MDLKFSKEDLEFQEEVLHFLDRNYPVDIKEKQDKRLPLEKSDIIHWQKILSKKGWFAINWPLKHGGPDLSPTKNYVLQNSLADANDKDKVIWLTSPTGRCAKKRRQH